VIFNYVLANKKIRRDFIKNQNAKVKIKKSKIAERMAEGKVGGNIIREAAIRLYCQCPV